MSRTVHVHVHVHVHHSQRRSTRRSPPPGPCGRSGRPGSSGDGHAARHADDVSGRLARARREGALAHLVLGLGLAHARRDVIPQRHVLPHALEVRVRLRRNLEARRDAFDGVDPRRKGELCGGLCLHLAPPRLVHRRSPLRIARRQLRRGTRPPPLRVAVDGRRERALGRGWRARGRARRGGGGSGGSLRSLSAASSAASSSSSSAASPALEVRAEGMEQGLRPIAQLQLERLDRRLLPGAPASGARTVKAVAR
mmetsp:Transcript_36048/g.116027  ORF Transcript_36048/g.116027 Transcript_36048/m.116027 type:complete len:254 (+) Transcript_36048:676-1437(+)